MISRCLSIFIVALFAAHPARADNLTVERLHADPPLVGDLPRALQYSPDGQTLGYLKANSEDADLYDFWVMDVPSGDKRRVFALAELLSREAVATRAVTAEVDNGEHPLTLRTFTWWPGGGRILFTLAGDVFLYDLAGDVLRALTDTRAREAGARFSPDGRRLAYVRSGDIYMLDLTTGRERRLTRTGSALGPIRNGLAEYVAAEEMKRFTGFWWSPDGRRVAFVETDESGLETGRRLAINADGYQTLTPYFPRAGEPNVAVRLGILNVETGRKRWARISDFEYLARVKWLPSGDGLLTVTQSRDQKRLDVTLLNRKGRVERVLIREEAATWINLTHDLELLAGQNRFLWTSERDGEKRVYLYDLDGRLLGPLTEGLGYLDEVAGVDANGNRLFLTGWRDTPLEKHLFVTDLDPATPDPPRRLTAPRRWHHAVVSPDKTTFIDVDTAATDLPRVALRAADGTLIHWIAENRLTDGHPYAPFVVRHTAPDFGVIEAADGTPLHYRLVKPAGDGPFPAILHMYGGPKGQVVRRGWMPMWYQIAVARGFAVFSLDNRGTARRGHAFESVLSGELGAIEVADQIAGLDWLRAQPFIDPDRIAVRGWSYGGYMALKLILAAPDRLAAAISGAPVTDWRLYDTHYTERFLGLPSANAAAYDRADVFPEIEKLARPLLLIHGLADGNVSFENSTRLMEALQTGAIPFEVMVYPGEGHSIRAPGADAHLDGVIFDFLDRKLKR